MKIGIISDTHDRLERTEYAVRQFLDEGAEAIVHCGDMTGPEVVRICGVLPSYFVFGNNDEYEVASLRRAIAIFRGVCLDWGGQVVLAGKRLAVTHGHLPSDVRLLTAKQPDYLLVGHSHHAADRREGRMRRINPGALHRAAELAVAVLDLETDRLKFLPVPR